MRTPRKLFDSCLCGLHHHDWGLQWGPPKSVLQEMRIAKGMDATRVIERVLGSAECHSPCPALEARTGHPTGRQ